MKKKNALLLVTSFAGLTTLLASCFGGNIEGKPDLTVDVEQHSDITINAYFPDFGCDIDKIKQGVLGKEIVKQADYAVNWHQLSSSADTEINTLLSSKEPIDMLKCAPTVFNNYVTSGFFTDLTEVIKKYGQRVVDSKGTKFVDIFTKEQWDACSYNGKIYAIPECGHTYMASQALIWNTDHLKAVEITKIPETVSEFKEALYKLQNKYGSDNNYHAFGLTGNIASNNSVSPAFGVPTNWYVDDNGELQNMINSPQMANYLKFMNQLKRDSIIVADWSGQMEPTAIQNFVKGYCSVYCGSYWHIKSLRNALVASYRDFPEDVMTKKQKTEYVRGTSISVPVKDDALVGWRVGLRGDGTNGSENQAKSMFRDGKSVGYFITVPVACAERAAYTVDWVTRKNHEDVTRLVAAGMEGTHWDYCSSQEEGAIKLFNNENKYVKKYDAYDTDISGMEQFQTGVYCDAARQWWPLAEAGFDAWNVLIVDEEGKEDTSRIIPDAFTYHPVIASFAKQDLQAQNYVITKVQNIINSTTDEIYEDRLSKSKEEYRTKYYNKFATDINSWYKSSKAN